MPAHHPKTPHGSKRLSAIRVVFYLLAVLFAGLALWAYAAPQMFPPQAAPGGATGAVIFGVLGRFAPRRWLERLLGPWP